MDTPVAATVSLDTPIGRLTAVERGGAIVSLNWGGQATPGDAPGPTPLLAETKRQLAAYFAMKLTDFDLPLAPAGDALEQQVYAAMQAIPYGRTRTYGEIAEELGTYGQPIGKACGANPIPVIIPCHRVLSVNGLGGYSGAGGIETKISLLKLEGGYSLLL